MGNNLPSFNLTSRRVIAYREVEELANEKVLIAKTIFGSAG